MHRLSANFLGLEWLGEKSGQDSSCSSALQLSMLHIAVTQLQQLLDAAGYFLLFRIPPRLLFLQEPPDTAIPGSSCALCWKWGQEALQMLPNRFRKTKVLLYLPLIINLEDWSKTTKTESKKILSLRRLLVKAFDISKRFVFDRAVGLLLCPL